MKNIAKSTFREIHASFGRFMAILAIIALGVGFFAGLKVTRAGMLASMKDYWDEHGLYDFRLLSTLGFEEKDVTFFQEQDDVFSAESGISFDVLYLSEGGSQGVVKTISLPQTINTVTLAAGRLPERSDECVADSKMLSESAIGTTITLSDDNEEDTLSHFSHKSYTIVGLVRSPLYVQYERGNTSLGTGQLDGYVYLLPEGYETDYATEIYIRFRGDRSLYGNDYSSFIKDKESVWEDLAKQAADRRYQSIKDEADDKLNDAREELASKKKDGEKELADALAKLEDARKEIADGKQAVNDAKAELTDGKKQISDAKAELADGKKTLADAKAELANGKKQIADAKAELSDGRNKLDQSKKELADAEQKLADARKELEDGRPALTNAKAELAQKKQTLTEQKQTLEAAAAFMDPATLAAKRAELAAAEQMLADAEAQFAAQAQTFEENEKLLIANEQELSNGKRELAAKEKELTDGEKELTKKEKELADGEKELADKEKELADGEKELADKEKELADGEQELADKEKELADAEAELADGEKKYRDSKKEFDEKIADAQKELDDAEKELSDLSAPDTYVLGRNTNIGYVCFENDSDIVEGISLVFPVFFFLVAALVCITTMNRMVEEQRTQIGVLKALGYGSFTIMSKYIVYSGLAAVIGCVFGFALGTWGFPRIIWSVYGIMYQTVPMVYVFDGTLALISLFVSLLCSVGTTFLSCRMELSSAAAQLMRPKAPKAGKRVFLERIPIIWKHLSFLRKVSVRNIFRYKKRLFMMVLGISGCTALLVTGFGIKDSIADIAARQFEDVQFYNLGATFKHTADENTVAELERLKSSGIADFLCVSETSMDLVTDKGTKNIYLVTADANCISDYVNMHTTKKASISYPKDGECVITHKLAEQYGIKANDTVTLQNDKMQKLTVRVSAIMENFVNHYVYITENTWNQAFSEEPQYRTAYINLADGADAHALAAELMNYEDTANVTVNQDVIDRIGRMMSSLNLIVVVVILCAAGLAFIVLYNLTNINITERIREIATIKVLGFYKQETASYVFRENLLLTLLGMLPGLLLGKLLHAFVMSQIKIDLIAFAVRVAPLSYLLSVLLTLAFAWMVNFAMRGKLAAISMTESLKSVD